MAFLLTALLSFFSLSAFASFNVYHCSERDVADGKAWTITFFGNKVQIKGSVILIDPERPVHVLLQTKEGKKFPDPIGIYRGTLARDELRNIELGLDGIDVINSRRGETHYTGYLYKFKDDQTKVERTPISCWGKPLNMKF